MIKATKKNCPYCNKEMKYNSCTDKKTATVTVVYEWLTCKDCDYIKYLPERMI